MQKRNHQSKVDHKSQVGKLKLMVASALLLIVIALACIAIPLRVATLSALTPGSHAQSVSIQPAATPREGCNPDPKC